jgi:hypothetical protein
MAQSFKTTAGALDADGAGVAPCQRHAIVGMIGAGTTTSGEA